MEGNKIILSIRGWLNGIWIWVFDSIIHIQHKSWIADEILKNWIESLEPQSLLLSFQIKFICLEIKLNDLKFECLITHL